MLKYILSTVLLCFMSIGNVYSNENDFFSLQQGKYDISIEGSDNNVTVELFGLDSNIDYQYQLFYKENGNKTVISNTQTDPSFTINIDTSSSYQVGIAVLEGVHYFNRSPIEEIEAGQFIGLQEGINNEADNLQANTSGLNTTLKIDSDSFPFVFIESAIDFNGIPYDGETGNLPLLTKDNFTISEDGRFQSIIGITPPSGQSSNKKIADILFVHDDSGSLGDEAAQVKANITSFVSQLASNNIDFRIGLLPYGGGGGFSTPSGTLLNGGLLHNNTADFIKDINKMRFDGGTERAFDAMFLGISQTIWRPSTQKIIILITDENNDTGSIGESTVTLALQDEGVTVYGLTRGHAEFNRIATATNGNTFNITSDFSSILTNIGNTIGASYIVRYETDNPNLDGQKRTVEVKLTAKDQQGIDHEKILTGEYTATPPVSIVLTPDTVSLGNKGQRQSGSLSISARITRNGIVDNAINSTLFFRHANDVTYNSVAMTNIGNGLYEAKIPANTVAEPFVSYYISASDGSSVVTFPISDPGNNPLSISVLPNLPPSIQHTRIFSAGTNQDIAVSATVEDITNQVNSVSLFYRPVGSVTYQEVGQSFGQSRVSFSGTIPASATQNTNAIEYYLEAVDDFGVISRFGNASNPIKTLISGPPSVNLDHRDVGSIRVYAETFTDKDGQTCQSSGFVLCTASGRVAVGTVKGNSPLLGLGSSLQLEENSKKIISLNSGKIIALNIKRNVSKDAENIPIYESNIEIDASDPLQDAVMRVTGGRSLLQLLGTVKLTPQTSLITIKDDEVVIHNVIADITQYITVLVEVGDIVLNQSGNSTGTVKFSLSDVLKRFPITLPSCGVKGVCKTKWSLSGLELTLDFINSAITGKAGFGMQGIIGGSKGDISATLGFLTDPFALEQIGGGVDSSKPIYVIPIAPPLGLGFDGMELNASNLSSAVAPKLTVTGKFSITDAAGAINILGFSPLNGDVALLIDLSGKYGITGGLTLFEHIPLAQAKMIYENKSLTGEAAVNVKLGGLVTLDGLIFFRVGYNNNISINGELLSSIKLDQSVAWIGGKTIAQNRLVLQSEFTAGNIEKAEISTDIKLFFIDIGVRIDVSDVLSPHLFLRGWNREIKVFKSAQKRISLNKDGLIFENVIVNSDLESVVIKVESDSGAAVFDIVFPDGSVFTPGDALADQASPNINKIFFVSNEDANEAFYAIKSPQGGSYELRIKNESELGNYNVTVFTPNAKPTINLLSQSSNSVWDGSTPIDINWNDSDVDTNAEISLYYDTDDSGLDGVLIVSGIKEDDVNDSFSWNVANNIPASGEYHIYALIDDGETMPEVSYSNGRVKIDNPLAPKTPTNFVVQAGDGNLTATWDANTESKLFGYRLYLSEVPGNDQYEYDFATADNTTWTIPGLENGKTYEIALAAVNDDGLESIKTQAINVTPAGTSTGGSPDLTVDVENSSISSSTGLYEDEITIQFIIKNEGKFASYAAKIDTYLGSMATRQLLGTKSIGQIDPGDSVNIEYTFNTNDLADLDTGRRVYIDIRDVQLTELNTGNNTVLLSNKLASRNTNPVANNDIATTVLDNPIIISSVLLNDSDVDGDILSVLAADTTSSQGGVVTNHGDGTFTYTPKSGFVGTDTFTYTVSDDNGGLDTGTIAITVNAPADTDGDGILDSWEDDNGLDKTDPADALLDGDGDGLNNLEEFQNGTKPSTPDTDGDGANDGDEVVAATDPLDDASFPPPTAIPTLSEWAMILLILSLGLLGFGLTTRRFKA